MSLLYFLHGWGYDASFWAPLRAALPPHRALCADAGYFHTSHTSALPAEPFWAIGHSAGACTLLTHHSPHCRGLISINGFARFCHAEDFPQGVPQRLIERMRRQLRRHPQETLLNFRLMCGEIAPSLPPHLNTPQLEEGLHTLQNADHRAFLPHWTGRLYSLTSPDDTLSPAQVGLGPLAQTTALPGGHLLPQTHPHECAHYINQIIQPL